MLHILNDPLQMAKLDSRNALETTKRYPTQFREGMELGFRQFTPPWNPLFDKIVILGTGGGAAASAYLLKDYLFDKCKIPIFVNHGYKVPGYLDDKTLVIVVSYSGKTEEIISAYLSAIPRGCFFVVITTGGKIEQLARCHDHPIVRIPCGMAPRSALGYLFVPMLIVVQRLGLVCSDHVAEEVEETIGVLEQLSQKYAVEIPVEQNLAKQIALKFVNTIPLFYGTETTEAVAWRWKRQFNENAKTLAFFNSIPSLHHDEITGWDVSNPFVKWFSVVFFHDRDDSEEIKKRICITKELLQGRVGEIVEVESEGVGKLSRMFSLVYLGDFVSLYFSMLKNVDPSPVNMIDLLKQKMNEMRQEL